VSGAYEAARAIVGPEAALVHEHWLAMRAGDYAPTTRARLELGMSYSAVDYLRAQQLRAKLTSEFAAAFEEVDLIISPTVAWVAPLEDPGEAGEEGAMEARRTRPYNLTGMPAVSVPCGVGEDALPAGLQIAGPRLKDFRVLQAAHVVEARSMWSQARPRDVAAGS
jgi:aspartyl-tRNA(Asn)/glutamyl-tRNA(Gln) amidotransferase subunit A